MRLSLLLLPLFITARLLSAELLSVDKDRSSIEVAVKATMDPFTAKLSAYDAALTADASPARIASAQVKFRFLDVKTGKDKRDAEMHKWQQTDQFADCLYVMEKLAPAGGDNFTATGKFTLHGVTKEISFPIAIRFQPDGSCKLDSDFPLDTQDYGLPVFRKFALLKVDPLLKIKIHLEARPAPAK